MANGLEAQILQQLTRIASILSGTIKTTGGGGGGGGGGDASAANQTTEIARLTSLVAALTNPLPVTFSAITQLPAALTAGGNLKVSIQEDAGNVISVDDGGGSLTVDGSISVSNFPATQAVSLAAGVDVTDRVGRLLGVVSVSNFPATQPVSGTFWQATQPVSLATNTPDVTDRAARLLGVIQSITAALPAGANKLGTVDIATAPATAKGVQGANAVPVQQLNDAGRVWRSLRFTSAAAPAADTLCSLTPNLDGVDGGAATTHAVTAGKRFRVMFVTLAVRTTTAATPWGLATIRVNPTGAAIIGSPAVFYLGVGGTAAVIGNVASDILTFADGWELSGTQQVGISFANNVATNVTNLVLHGYEY